jgi:hypothetical protein
MGRQQKAMVNRLRRAKCKEQKKKETKEEKGAGLARQAKAQAEHVETMSPVQSELPTLGLFHLHPELVPCFNESNTESTHLCGNTFSHSKKSSACTAQQGIDTETCAFTPSINFSCGNPAKFL